MKKNNTFSRIHKIYDILDRGGFFSAQEISEITGEPKGTISPLLSALVSTKNIVNDRGNGYKSEYFHKDLKQIAQDVSSYEKKRRETIQGKRKAKLKKLQNIVDQVANEMPAQLSIDVNKAINDLRELKRSESNEINAAVELLKSKGYKILAPVTEFKEI